MKGVFAILAVASLCACGGGGSSSTSPNTSPPKVNTTPPAGGISVTNNQYSPGTKTIAVGANVTWAWNACTGDPYNGQSCVSHSVTFDDGSASSPLQDQGSFTKSFATAGTYTYHCTVHGSQGMTGTITVQ